MSFDSLLVNTVVVEKRTITTNDTNEELATYTDAGTITASVQDRAPTELTLPDFDGPVIVNAIVFTRYSDGLAVDHLDILRQTDVSPSRRYTVIFPDDPAGRHHHFEMRCQRILAEAVGS
jgi:head-tail adaptor